jgi:hypothetical protein
MWGFHLSMHDRREGHTRVEGFGAFSVYAYARCLYVVAGTPQRKLVITRGVVGESEPSGTWAVLLRRSLALAGEETAKRMPKDRIPSMPS